MSGGRTSSGEPYLMQDEKVSMARAARGQLPSAVASATKNSSESSQCPIPNKCLQPTRNIIVRPSAGLFSQAKMLLLSRYWSASGLHGVVLVICRVVDGVLRRWGWQRQRRKPDGAVSGQDAQDTSELRLQGVPPPLLGHRCCDLAQGRAPTDHCNLPAIHN